MELISVNYLPNERPYYFSTIFKEFSKISDENKDKVKVNIFNSNEHEPDIDTSILKDNGIRYETIYQPHLGRHYMGKVEKAVDISGKYSISLDEDVFLNRHIWDFMIENCSILDDNKNLFMSPLLSTGVPMVDWFVEQFFDEDEKLLIFNSFKNVHVQDLGSSEDYEILNNHTIRSNKDYWDYSEFYKEVDKLNTYYKGIHPVRCSSYMQTLINDMILKKKDKLLEKQDYKIFCVKNRPYFCNNVYMIKTNIWEKIVYDSSLFVDKFDEVPLNKFRIIHDMNMVFIKNAFGVHPSYNWIGMEKYRELSDKFFDLIGQ